MPKTLKLTSIILFFFSLFPVAFSQTDSLDSIRIVTYYPSPFGTYRELRTKRLAIGDDYIKTGSPPDKYDWQEYPTDPMHNIAYDADLVVQGSVGIGTTAPRWGQLQVNSVDVPLAFKETDQSGAGSIWRMPLDSRSIRFDSSDNGVDFGPPYTAVLRLYPNGGIAVGDTYCGISINSTPTVPVNGAIIQGNVGIGTTEPQTKLHIGGVAGTDGIIFPDNTKQVTAAGFNKESDVSSALDQNTTGTSWVDVTGVSKVFTARANKICIIKCRVAMYMRGSSATTVGAGARLVDDLGNVLAIKTGWYYGVTIFDLDSSGFLTAGNRTVRLQFRGDDQAYTASIKGTVEPTVLSVYD